MNPHSPFSIQWIEMNVGIAGTAQGRMKTSSKALTHRLRWMKKPDSSRARNKCRFTPMTRNTTVLTSVLR